jgi:hypothetical protein
MPQPNRYSQLLERVFFQRYTEGAREVDFLRDDIVAAATELGLKLPKNLGDVIYSFRYRADLPGSVMAKAPAGESWIILPAGMSKYRFLATAIATVGPRPGLAETKIPDSTPGLIGMYALTDEQALLAKLRYNRLIDIFTGVTCYSLQNHLRTTVSDLGQVETDEIYVGVNRQGAHFVIPVQAKRGNDQISIVQIWQDWRMCQEKFQHLVCRPIAAQLLNDDLVAVFEFEPAEKLLRIRSEKRYRLVPKELVLPEDLDIYRARTGED